MDNRNLPTWRQSFNWTPELEETVKKVEEYEKEQLASEYSGQGEDTSHLGIDFTEYDAYILAKYGIVAE